MKELAYVERYRFPAGLLAVLVNGAFFAFIILGVSWKVTPQLPMTVDIWESLPDIETAPPVVDLPPTAPPLPPAEPPKLAKPLPPAPVKAPEPAKPSKAEIELTDKKKKQEKQKEAEKEALQKKKMQQEEARLQKQKEIAQAELAQAQAAKNAATNNIVNDYKTRILAKIKRNIKWPEEGRMTAVYEVTLLPDGSVLESKLVKPSGNAAYDRQTAAAIDAAQPLPLPPDRALFNQFRQIELKFSPTE